MYGLRLSLAEWDSEVGLVHSAHTHQYSHTPELLCWAVRRHQSEQDGMAAREKGDEQGGFYSCPLYSSTAKEECITYIQLKTAVPLQQLHLLGITLILC